MNIACPHCRADVAVPEEVMRRGVARVTCPACAFGFVIRLGDPGNSTAKPRETAPPVPIEGLKSSGKDTFAAGEIGVHKPRFIAADTRTTVMVDPGLAKEIERATGGPVSVESATPPREPTEREMSSPGVPAASLAAAIGETSARSEDRAEPAGEAAPSTDADSEGFESFRPVRAPVTPPPGAAPAPRPRPAPQARPRLVLPVAAPPPAQPSELAEASTAPMAPIEAAQPSPAPEAPPPAAPAASPAAPAPAVAAMPAAPPAAQRPSTIPPGPGRARTMTTPGFAAPLLGPYASAVEPAAPPVAAPPIVLPPMAPMGVPVPMPPMAVPPASMGASPVAPAMPPAAPPFVGTLPPEPVAPSGSLPPQPLAMAAMLPPQPSPAMLQPAVITGMPFATQPAIASPYPAQPPTDTDLEVFVMPAAQSGKAARVFGLLMSVLTGLFLLFALFVVARNDWSVDLSDVGRMLDRAFGRASRNADQPEELRGLEVSAPAVTQAQLASGERVITVMGVVKNNDTRPRRYIYVRARLRDNHGRPVLDIDAPAGNMFSPEQLAKLDRKGLQAQLKPGGFDGRNLRLDVGQNLEYMVVMTGLPLDYSSARYSVVAEVSQAEFRDEP